MTDTITEKYFAERAFAIKDTEAAKTTGLKDILANFATVDEFATVLANPEALEDLFSSKVNREAVIATFSGDAAKLEEFKRKLNEVGLTEAKIAELEAAAAAAPTTPAPTDSAGLNAPTGWVAALGLVAGYLMTNGSMMDKVMGGLKYAGLAGAGSAGINALTGFDGSKLKDTFAPILSHLGPLGDKIADGAGNIMDQIGGVLGDLASDPKKLWTTLAVVAGGVYGAMQGNGIFGSVFSAGKFIMMALAAVWVAPTLLNSIGIDVDGGSRALATNTAKNPADLPALSTANDLHLQLAPR